MKTDIILQARSTSTRLPGKVFLELRGRPMLEQILRRLLKVRGVRQVCVATIRKDVKRVREICGPLGCRVVWGSEPDVLGRYLKAVRTLGSEVVVRTTADNPLVDHRTLTEALERFDPDAMDALVVEGLPYGAGFEIVSASALERCGRMAKAPEEREHVTPFLYGHPELFRVGRLPAPERVRMPELRVTVDTAEDFERMRSWYEACYDEAEGTADLEEVVRRERARGAGLSL